ncbi:MAG: transglutaminase family protein [Cyanobacteria bacterium P01_F01_bin.42]
MTYRITHSLRYDYDPAVILNPQEIRLQPRADAYQSLNGFSLEVTPSPLGQTLTVDELGNLVTRCWWSPQPISALHIVAQSDVSTHCRNPFSYLLASQATHLPIDYPRSQLLSLFPYLDDSQDSLTAGPSVIAWAQELLTACEFNTVEFLDRLNQTIYSQWTYQAREQGPAYPASVTWKNRQGSCRDFVVLFMAACRAVGLASRFVSGYEEGSPELEQTLHAWAEVFLPGAGWRGYDPTLGLAVCDRHIALAAHRFPHLTVPVLGTYQGQTNEILTTHVAIGRLGETS